MGYSRQTWILGAVCGASLAVAGCHSRGNFVRDVLVKPPAQAEEVASREASAADESTAESPSDVASHADALDATTSPVSLKETTAATGVAVLEAAGALLEYDTQGAPIGVDLTAARISADVTRAVAELSQLQWVDLRGAAVTDQDLAIIGTLPRLQLVALSETSITDAGLVHLCHQKDLRFVSLDHTAVTDAGLATLAGLPRLEGISLAGTSVSQEAARAFEKRLPGCRVILDVDAPTNSPDVRPHAPAEPARDDSTSQTDNTWFLDDESPRTIPKPRQPVPVSRDLAETGEILRTTLEQKLLDADVLQALSQHLMAQQNYPKAAQALEAWLALDPDNDQARFDLGVALARSGQFEAALPHLSQIVGVATANYNVGVIAFERSQLSDSERYFSRAIELSPDFSEARQWLAHVRKSAAITPASQSRSPVEQDHLVNLLMSEVGSVGTTHSRGSSAGEIEIVPAPRSGTSSEPSQK